MVVVGIVVVDMMVAAAATSMTILAAAATAAVATARITSTRVNELVGRCHRFVYERFSSSWCIFFQYIKARVYTFIRDDIARAHILRQIERACV